MVNKIESRMNQLQQEYDKLGQQRAQLSSQVERITQRMFEIQGGYTELSAIKDILQGEKVEVNPGQPSADDGKVE